MIAYLLCTLFEFVAIAAILTKVFAKLTMGWCKSNTCLKGKTVLITGGNSGLGYQTALALAGRGAKVIIADVVDTQRSIQQIIEETQNPNIHGKFLDLASLDSVRNFCKDIYKEENQIDILINNAGIGGRKLHYTKDGLQVHMQTNYFGHFLLTHLLLDLLKRTQSRIIFVSSIGLFFNDLTLERLNKPTVYGFGPKTHFTIYCNSKICELIASNIFAEKLKNTSVTCNALHPGVVNTPLVGNAVNPNFHKWPKKAIYFLKWLFAKTPFEGAQTQIYCALSKDLDRVSGNFFADCTEFYQPRLARDKEFSRKIWEKTEELVKLRPEEKLM